MSSIVSSPFTLPLGRDFDPYAEAHANTKGPGDARPTAMQIVQDLKLKGQLRGSVGLITGCSSGIGVETARALHATGMDLFLTVRDVEAGEKVVADITSGDPKSKGAAGKVELLKLELDCLASVRECAEAFLKRSNRLNILITNAGVMATPAGKTKNGFETQFGTNHLGHFLLFQLLKDVLLASSTEKFHSRVISLSSVGHNFGDVQLHDLDFSKQDYSPWAAYGQSKTANIWMATELERRYGKKGLHGLAVHPGGILTGSKLARHLSPDVAATWDTPEMHAILKSVEQGAATTVWAALSPAFEHFGGVYLEECRVAKPRDPDGTSMMRSGYSTWAYDQERAAQLWRISRQMVGLPEEL